jgi:hypothetical protein
MQEAEDVHNLQVAIRRLDLSQDVRSQLLALIESEEGAAVLRNVTRFYGVLLGMPAGIYLN